MCEHTEHGTCFSCESGRLDGILDKLKSIGLDAVVITAHKIDQEFEAWLNTPHGKFETYCAERGQHA